MYEDENVLVFREIQNKTTMIKRLKNTAIIFVSPNVNVDGVINRAFGGIRS